MSSSIFNLDSLERLTYTDILSDYVVGTEIHDLSALAYLIEKTIGFTSVKLSRYILEFAFDYSMEACIPTIMRDKITRETLPFQINDETVKVLTLLSRLFSGFIGTDNGTRKMPMGWSEDYSVVIGILEIDGLMSP